MRQYCTWVYRLTFVQLIMVLGQVHDVNANKISKFDNHNTITYQDHLEKIELFKQINGFLDLKQSYCRDLRDCQTYFPCAVFSSGFSYLYVIKRCPNEQIFDEAKQKCVKNTFTDPLCVKQITAGKPRLTTVRSSIIKQRIRNNVTTRRNIKFPPRTTAATFIQRKNFEIDHSDSNEENFEQPTVKTPSVQLRFNHANTKMHRVCYVTNWSRYRSGEAKFEIEYIDPFMCSHIIYAYATVDENKPEIKPVQPDDIGKKEFIF